MTSYCFLSPPTELLNGLLSGDLDEKLFSWDMVCIDLPLTNDLLTLELPLEREFSDALDTNLPSSLDGCSTTTSWFYWYLIRPSDIFTRLLFSPNLVIVSFMLSLLMLLLSSKRPLIVSWGLLPLFNMPLPETTSSLCFNRLLDLWSYMAYLLISLYFYLIIYLVSPTVTAFRRPRSVWLLVLSVLITLTAFSMLSSEQLLESEVVTSLLTDFTILLAFTSFIYSDDRSDSNARFTSALFFKILDNSRSLWRYFLPF